MGSVFGKIAIESDALGVFGLSLCDGNLLCSNCTDKKNSFDQKISVNK